MSRDDPAFEKIMHCLEGTRALGARYSFYEPEVSVNGCIGFNESLLCR